MVTAPRLLTAALLFAGMSAPLAAQAGDYRFEVDLAQSQVNVSITSSLGTINVNPSTIGMGGALEVKVQNTFAGTTDLTILDGFLFTTPSTINATVPNPLPFLPPLATATVKNLYAAIEAPLATANLAGAITLDPTMTTTGGTVSLSGLLGSGTEPVFGIPSSPTTVTGTFTNNAGVMKLQFNLNVTMTMVLDPGTGTTADITLVGPIVATADMLDADPMRLEGPRPLVPGAQATFDVHNAPASQPVFLGASLVGIGSTFIAPLGVAVNMTNPIQVGGAYFANPAGLSINAVVPASVTGRSLLLQAVTLGEASNLLSTWVQ